MGTVRSVDLLQVSILISESGLTSKVIERINFNLKKGWSSQKGIKRLVQLGNS